MQKQSLLLLDADVIIAAHKMGIWETLKKTFQISVPATIIKEARYFKSSHGANSINLKKQIENKEIECIEGLASELLSAFAKFDAVFMKGIDEGEKEGIAIIAGGRYPDHCFCTGDTNATEALGMLALEAKCLSFEEVLMHAKIKDQKVRPSMSSQAHTRHIEIGKTRRMSGEYFIKSPFK